MKVTAFDVRGDYPKVGDVEQAQPKSNRVTTYKGLHAPKPIAKFSNRYPFNKTVRLVKSLLNAFTPTTDEYRIS